MFDSKYNSIVFTALFTAFTGMPAYTGPLHDAANDGDIKSVIALHDQGMDLNAKDEFNMTALHFASYSGRKEVVDYLLTNKVEVNSKNDGGYTALILAIDAGHSEIAKMLIEYGADANVGLSEIETPLKMAWDNGNKEIARLLIEHGADINIEFEESRVRVIVEKDKPTLPGGLGECPSTTLFHDVLKSDDYSMVKLFLENGADPNRKCIYFDIKKRRKIVDTPLTMATSYEIKKLLREYGAKNGERSSTRHGYEEVEDY
jgi:ankyrin repeat protein